jgi:hypothetical protein
VKVLTDILNKGTSCYRAAKPVSTASYWSLERSSQPLDMQMPQRKLCLSLHNGPSKRYDVVASVWLCTRSDIYDALSTAKVEHRSAPNGRVAMG